MVVLRGNFRPNATLNIAKLRRDRQEPKSEERETHDPFKAKYPNPPEDHSSYKFRKRFQEFYKQFNNYNETGYQPRYQFTLSNKMIYVSPTSITPKIHKIGSCLVNVGLSHMQQL